MPVATLEEVTTQLLDDTYPTPNTLTKMTVRLELTLNTSMNNLTPKKMWL